MARMDREIGKRKAVPKARHTGPAAMKDGSLKPVAKAKQEGRGSGKAAKPAQVRSYEQNVDGDWAEGDMGAGDYGAPGGSSKVSGGYGVTQVKQIKSKAPSSGSFRASDGLGGGKGGMAVHKSARGVGMHTDKMMYEEDY